MLNTYTKTKNNTYLETEDYYILRSSFFKKKNSWWAGERPATGTERIEKREEKKTLKFGWT